MGIVQPHEGWHMKNVDFPTNVMPKSTVTGPLFVLSINSGIFSLDFQPRYLVTNNSQHQNQHVLISFQNRHLHN